MAAERRTREHPPFRSPASGRPSCAAISSSHHAARAAAATAPIEMPTAAASASATSRGGAECRVHCPWLQGRSAPHTADYGRSSRTPRSARLPPQPPPVARCRCDVVQEGLVRGGSHTHSAAAWRTTTGGVRGSGGRSRLESSLPHGGSDSHLEGRNGSYVSPRSGSESAVSGGGRVRRNRERTRKLDRA